MKKNIIYFIATLVILACSIIKIMHWPGANEANFTMLLTIAGVTFYLIWQNQLLSKKLKENQHVNNQ